MESKVENVRYRKHLYDPLDRAIWSRTRDSMSKSIFTLRLQLII